MKLRGTMLTPGVSKNGRLYTPELIQKAHDRLAERIKAGDRPVTMLTHHDAGDDSTRIVAHVTAVAVNGQDLDFEAETAATDHAKTIEQLVSPDKPLLRNVSIRGAWVGPIQTKTLNGESVTTADDIDIDGLDFTKNPGVTGAYVEPAPGSAAAEAASNPALIVESVQLTQAVFTEDAPPTIPDLTESTTVRPDGLPTFSIDETTKAPYGDVTYADPGYQTDKKKRYPLDTKDRAKAAWSYINQADNAKPYSAAQLKRVKGRIKSALKKYGVQTSETTEGQIVMTETAPAPEVKLSECMACYQDGTGTAGFSISAYNGPLTVSVSAYNGIEPADLAGVATAAMAAAMDAVKAMDPDVDGDIDTGSSDETGTKPTNRDDQMETAPPAPTKKEPTVAETTTETAPAATETTTTATEEKTTFTKAELDEAVAAAVTAAKTTTETTTIPPAATESAAIATASPALTEADVQKRIDEAVAKAKKDLEETVVANIRDRGLVLRKGLVESAGDAPKALHEMSDEEFRALEAKNAGLFFDTH